MKLITATLMLGLAAGSAWAQNPDIIENTRNTVRAVQLKQTIDINHALGASGQDTKPVMTAPAHAGTKPVSLASPQPKPAPTKTKIEVVKQMPHATTAAKTAPVAKGKRAKREMVRVPRAPKPAPMQVAVEDKKNPVDPKEKKVISFTGKRDPFVSPVVNHSMTGSGCSTGKRCLAIDQIALRGVVKSDDGMIAVVVNALDKAYFLRENDPVFDGYVVKITGDSIIFKETLEDKLGKPFTREVTKRIATPAV
jgi:Tfp pilus assembly protein PilP